MDNNCGMIRRGPRWYNGPDEGLARIGYRQYRIKAFFARDAEGRPTMSLKFFRDDTFESYVKRRAAYYLRTAWSRIKYRSGYTKARRRLKRWRYEQRRKR